MSPKLHLSTLKKIVIKDNDSFTPKIQNVLIYWKLLFCIRYSYDGLKRQRLTKPMMKDESGNLTPCTWEEALVEVAQKMTHLNGNEIAAVAGGFADAEALVALKDLLNSYDSEGLYTEEGFPSDGSG